MINIQNMLSVKNIMSWYDTQAAKDGWTQSGSFNDEGTSMLMFTKGNRYLNVSAGPAEDEADFSTVITLTVTEM